MEVSGEKYEDRILLILTGRIDSDNAGEAEKAAAAILENGGGLPLVVDAKDLNYISSAGLRMLLHLRKDHPDMTITQTSSEVYEILDMTGFTQMMTVEKAYKVISVEGCEKIGQGANGTIYRIDRDNVVKVYNNPDSLEDIRHEREVARIALVLGIPTAISYDIVKVGDSYGSVFELLNACSFSKILAEEPEKMDWCVKEYIRLLKKIHRTVVPEGQLPDMRETALGWAEFMKDYLPEAPAEKLLEMVRAIPKDPHMIHGDYHTKNVEKVGDEVLLIDMDTLAVGHPVFELASMFNAFVGFSECDPNRVLEFQGFPQETSLEFWKKSLAAYLGTRDPEQIRAVEDRARILGYTRLIRRSIRRGGLESEEGKREIDHWTEELLLLIGRIDSLVFTPNEQVFPADTRYLGAVMAFVEEQIEDLDCPMKAKMQVNIAVEEIFTNVAHYAYAPDTGMVKIRVQTDYQPDSVEITFVDQGVPYNPLEKEDPDVTLSADERRIGGLGIFMVKQIMDEVCYEYRNGSNVVTLKKRV